MTSHLPLPDRRDPGATLADVEHVDPAPIDLGADPFWDAFIAEAAALAAAQRPLEGTGARLARLVALSH